MSSSLFWALAGSNVIAWISYAVEVKRNSRVVVRFVEEYADLAGAAK